MQRRYESKNVPIEVLRSFVTVVDSGSFTKAAEQLDLTQAAVSSQIARLRRILLGKLFTRGPGSQLTSRGATALSYARRIVEMNDQLITTAGPKPAPRHLVIALPRWYDYDKLIALILACVRAPISEKVSFRCGEVGQTLRDLSSGAVDIAYLANVSEPPPNRVVEWLVTMHWTKSPSLMLSAGDPVPLVGWPGTLSERLATKLLSDAEIPYSVAFTGADHAARKAAVAAGLGSMLMVEHAMTPEIEIARESFLPNPPVI